MKHFMVMALVAAALWSVSGGQPTRGQGASLQRVAAGQDSMTPGTTNGAALAALRGLNNNVTAMTNAGQLRSVRRDADTLVAGRRHERLTQYYRGVRVYGGEMVRQTNFFGQVVSIFGSYYQGIGIDTTPGINASLVPRVIAAAGLGTVRPGTALELTVLPVDDGTFRLTWSAHVLTGASPRRIFVDARTGDEVFGYNDFQTQKGLAGSVGSGTGVIGDLLKVQSQASSGKFLAVDLNRPGQDTTYNMQGSFSRTNAVLAGSALTTSDIATDTDNKWTDGAVVSAQVYAGYTYDYYKQMFNRSGLDGNNIKIRCLVNPARPQDAASPPIASDPSYYNNAFYYTNGYIVFGVGQTTGGQIVYRNWAGALDVVAHELTHGVTQFTSNLNCCDEAGSLNEAFSDMMGVAIEFRFQPLGIGLGKSDWLVGEDVATDGSVVRSLSNPHSVLGAKGPDPDHYSLKQIGFPYTLANDFGWVHANSNIVSHMYYLAIMGGTNRVSGQTVQGVGFNNRQLIERAIFRAFTVLMPSNSTFVTCRAATIQAARDLYGNGSPAENALTQAWNAVGVVGVFVGAS